MIYIKVKINKFISNDQPGFVNCSFTDIHNKDWSFTEKIPIVTKEIIDENTTLPKDGFIAGEIIKQWNNNGKQIITINTEKPWDISSDGNAEFDVYLDQTVNQL